MSTVRDPWGSDGKGRIKISLIIKVAILEDAHFIALGSSCAIGDLVELCRVLVTGKRFRVISGGLTTKAIRSNGSVTWNLTTRRSASDITVAFERDLTGPSWGEVGLKRGRRFALGDTSLHLSGLELGESDGGRDEVDVLLDVLGNVVLVASNVVLLGWEVVEEVILRSKEALQFIDRGIELEPASAS